MKRPAVTGIVKTGSADHSEDFIAPDRHLSGAEVPAALIAASRRRHLDQRYVQIVPAHAPSRSSRPSSSPSLPSATIKADRGSIIANQPEVFFMAEDIDASHTAGNAAATATPSMETATMADIDLSIDAPALPDVPTDDGGVGPISIDDIIVRIRAAHDQGMTINDINAHLLPIIGQQTAGHLLGLEASTPPAIDIMGEVQASFADDRNHPRLSPLLGTITSQVIENVGGSSKDGPPSSFCSTQLLHSMNIKSSAIPRNTTGTAQAYC
jgi:hypothetical protein